jgi:hypothetical protein
VGVAPHRLFMRFKYPERQVHLDFLRAPSPSSSERLNILGEM